MKHYMRLHPEPFEMIKKSIKTAEGRLNDKKRAIIQSGDEIVFLKRPEEKESISVLVTNKILFDSFTVLAKKYDLEKLGFQKDSSVKDCVDCFRKYYSEDDENENGVVVIEFELK